MKKYEDKIVILNWTTSENQSNFIGQVHWKIKI